MPRTKMSTSPSFPLGNDYTDRPLSVYDNLSSGPISNGNRDYPKSPNGHPLTNISFQFDHGIGNGSSPSHTVASAQQQSPAAINNNNNNNRSSSTSPVKNSIALINVTPEINSDLVVKNGQGFETMNDRAGQLASESPPRLAAAPVAYSPAKSDAALSNANTIVTTKPVISDAKSKFFGLTSATSDRSASDDLRSESNVPLLRDVQPQYQIVKPPPVNTTAISDHRYQNIPPNSAIFRKLNESAEPAEKISKDIAGPYHHHHHHHHPHHPHDHITIMPDFPVTAATEKSFPENQAINDDDNIRNHSNRSTKSFQADMELNFTQQQPSQVIYMSTTVPQNIKGPNIAGRHTPTRNSLRHSRMLVVNKNYQGLNKTNPLDLKHPRIARILLILLLILGLMITAIGTWILLWAPYTRMQDNPYWSGLSLILAGTLGLIVIKFKRIKRQKIREHCFTFLMVDSLMLTMVACILCLAAFSCASLHLNNLISPNTKCASTNILIANASCTCIFGARDTNFTPPNGTTMQNRTAEFFSGGYEFHYNDLSCSEVNGAWHYLLIISIVLNVLGFFLGSCYLLLACFKKTAKRKIYNTIQTNVF